MNVFASFGGAFTAIFISESTRVELQKAIFGLSKAWELVHERLTEHGMITCPIQIVLHINV